MVIANNPQCLVPLFNGLRAISGAISARKLFSGIFRPWLTFRAESVLCLFSLAASVAICSIVSSHHKRQWKVEEREGRTRAPRAFDMNL